MFQVAEVRFSFTAADLKGAYFFHTSKLREKNGHTERERERETDRQTDRHAQFHTEYSKIPSVCSSNCPLCFLVCSVL